LAEEKAIGVMLSTSRLKVQPLNYNPPYSFSSVGSTATSLDMTKHK